MQYISTTTTLGCSIYSKILLLLFSVYTYFTAPPVSPKEGREEFISEGLQGYDVPGGPPSEDFLSSLSEAPPEPTSVPIQPDPKKKHKLFKRNKKRNQEGNWASTLSKDRLSASLLENHSKKSMLVDLVNFFCFDFCFRFWSHHIACLFVLSFPLESLNHKEIKDMDMQNINTALCWRKVGHDRPNFQLANLHYLEAIILIQSISFIILIDMSHSGNAEWKAHRSLYSHLHNYHYSKCFIH